MFTTNSGRISSLTLAALAADEAEDKKVNASETVADTANAETIPNAQEEVPTAQEIAGAQG